MYLSDAVRDRIRFYQKQKGMSLWGLFKASGVPMSTLAAFMSKRTELIKLDTLLHICEGFGITINSVPMVSPVVISCNIFVTKK